jgi:queuine tRNA-ribosyltransferase
MAAHLVERLNPFRFEIQAVCPATGARAGLLRTAHGVVETPVFMPVGTQGTVKGLTPRQLLEELDARMILGNTYHLYLRPGHELIGRHGGLHAFAGWPRAILTDSGGFQVWSLRRLRKLREAGVEFQSHLDGSRHLFTPESAVDVQLALGSDILMMLDECLEFPASHEAARQSTALTVRWARRGMDQFRARLPDPEPGRAIFPIVQGSMFADLRRDCAARLVELGAAGYAIGGLSVGEPRALSLEMTEVASALLPAGRPRYVMGVGTPEELPEYVARGIDMMDCVMPTRNARNGCLFTSLGKLLIKQARFRDDPLPLDRTCACYTCRTFSRAYLRHLFLAGEILFSTVASLHNLAYYLDIMRRMRESILLGSFPEFLMAARSRPAVLE